MDSVNKDYYEKNKLNYQILNGIADLVRVLDTSNTVVFVNRAMEETLGYDTKTLTCDINQSVLKSDITRRTLETGEIIQREENLDGQSFSVKCSPILGAHGEIVGAVEVFRNTTYEKKLQQEIIDKNKSMTVEMRQASKIQQSLLPEKGFLDNLELDYMFKPSNMLSGDMFDLFKINNDNIGVYVADAVGHGFASSMVTMFIRLLIRNLSASKLLKPSKTLSEVNKRFALLNLDIEIYFTFFYGVYNKKTGKFTFSNAGHFPSPMLYDGENLINLETSGFPISRFFTGVEYDDYYINLNCSDKILFMTDGITEAENRKKVPFGTDKVGEILKDNSVDELKIINSELDSYVWADQKDDMTALLVKIW